MITAIKREHRLGLLLPLAAATILAMSTGQARAMSITLCAEPYTVNLPGAAGVAMWGYRQVADAASCSATSTLRTTAAAPTITMPAGDSTLAVTLVNRLQVPTSVVIAGQALPADGGAAVNAEDLVGPSCTPSGANMACRVRSFTGETDAGASRTYTFTNLRPGTFLLQSGTHPQVQVQMGLFAPLRKDASPLGASRRLYEAAATDTNANFDVDATVVLSEVDAAQHVRIAATLGTAGAQTQWKIGNNSTLNYEPRHFLINGRPFDGANVSASDIGINAPNGARVVLRLANAGLQSRSLVLTNGTWQLLTEDAYPYAAPREQASVLLAAGKTSDAAMVAENAGAVGSTAIMGAVFDRRGGAVNDGGNAFGGQVARLAVTAATAVNRPPLVSVSGSGTYGAGAIVNIAGSATDDGLPVPPGALAASWSVSGPAGGTTLPASPSTTGTPFPMTFALPGRYVVQLLANDGELSTAGEAVVTIATISDLALTNVGSAAVTGSTTTFTVNVVNNGPSASGANVAMTFGAGSPALNNLAWSCAAGSGGGTCGAPSGTGLLAASATLPAGANVTYTVTGQVPWNASGTLTSTATVTATGSTDPNPNNNTGIDSRAVVVAAPQPSALDNFDRANANTLGGNWQQAVALANAGIRVNGNQAFCVNSGLQAALCLFGANAYWNGTPDFGSQQAAAFTFANTTLNNASLVLKAAGTLTAGVYQNALRVRYALAVGALPNRVVVERTTTGVGFSESGNLPATFASGDRMTALVDAAGTVYVWKTSGATTTLLGSIAGTGATGTGRVGMFLPPGARVDNFAGGAVP